jgi:hypothetical protein
LALIPYKRIGCRNQRLGWVLLAPFSDPNVDSGVIDLELIAFVDYPPVRCTEKSA